MSLFQLPDINGPLESFKLTGDILLTRSQVDGLLEEFGEPAGGRAFYDELSPMWAGESVNADGPKWRISVDLNSESLAPSEAATWEETLEQTALPDDPFRAAIHVEILIESGTWSGPLIDQRADIERIFRMAKERFPVPMHVTSRFFFPSDRYAPVMDFSKLVPPKGFTEVEGVVLANRRLDADDKPLLFEVMVQQDGNRITVDAEFITYLTGTAVGLDETVERARSTAMLAISERIEPDGING